LGRPRGWTCCLKLMIARLRLAFFSVHLWHPALPLPPLPAAARVAVVVAHLVELAGVRHLPTPAHVIVRNRAWRADVSPDANGEGVTRRLVAAAERVMLTAVRQRLH